MGEIHYKRAFSCWLQLDTSLIYGQYIPFVILMVLIVMLYEAANSVDDDHMSKLPGKHELI